MVAASRGLEPGLVDTVILLDDHKMDLAPAFREMGAGQYWINLGLVNGSAPLSTGGLVEVQYAAHHPATVSCESGSTGLYRLSLVDKAGAPAGSDSWILISPRENYSYESRAFQVAVEKIFEMA